jgi:solute carrier family 35, member F5
VKSRPGFILLNWTGVEPFQLPPTPRIWLIVLSNSTASLVSDLFWAYAVLLTSPIVVTVGLSMTIPLSLIGQVLLNGQTSTGWYWVGAVVVVGSFVFVSVGGGGKTLHDGKEFGQEDHDDDETTDSGPLRAG